MTKDEQILNLKHLIINLELELDAERQVVDFYATTEPWNVYSDDFGIRAYERKKERGQ